MHCLSAGALGDCRVGPGRLRIHVRGGQEVRAGEGSFRHRSAAGKLRTSFFLNKVATERLQLHGGWGYMWEHPIAK